MSTDQRQDQRMPTTSTGQLIIFRFNNVSKVCPHYVDLKNQLLYIQQRFQIYDDYTDIKLSIEQNLLDSDFDAESWKYAGRLGVSADRNLGITLPVVKVSIKEPNADINSDSDASIGVRASGRARANTSGATTSKVQRQIHRALPDPRLRKEILRRNGRGIRRSSRLRATDGAASVVAESDGGEEELEMGYQSSFLETSGNGNCTVRAGKRYPLACAACKGKVGALCRTQQSKKAQSCYECRRDKQVCSFKHGKRKNNPNVSKASKVTSDELS